MKNTRISIQATWILAGSAAVCRLLFRQIYCYWIPLWESFTNKRIAIGGKECLNSIPVFIWNSGPSDEQSMLTERQNLRVVAMLSNSFLNVALANAHPTSGRSCWRAALGGAWCSAMPNKIHTCNIANAVKVDGFKTTPNIANTFSPLKFHKKSRRRWFSGRRRGHVFNKKFSFSLENLKPQFPSFYLFNLCLLPATWIISPTFNLRFVV